MKQERSSPRKAAIDEISALLDRCGSELLRTCVFYLRDVQLAEDALQETFMKAYRRYDGFHGKSSLKTWITRIAVNTCHDFLRKRVKERVGLDSLENKPAWDTPDVSADMEMVSRSVLELPIKFREAILLYYYHEMTLRDMSQALGAPVSTVSSRLLKARQMLKSKMKGWFLDE